MKIIFLTIFTLLVLVVGAIIPLGIALTEFKKYSDIHYMRLVLIALYLSLWNISRIFLLFPLAIDFITPSRLFWILRFGNICLFAGFLTIAYLLNNPFFGEVSRTLSISGFSLFSGAAVLVVSDFSNPKHIVYFIENGTIIIEFGRLIFFIIIIGAICITLSYVLAVRSLRKLPNTIYTNNSRYQFATLGVSIFVLGVWISFDNETLLDATVFNSTISIGVNIFYGLIYYYYFSQPFYQVNIGLSSKSIVERHYVGYVVGAITDAGPALITSSERFNNRVNISKQDLENLTLGVITALGINDTIDEKIAVFPVHGHREFATIVFSFQAALEGILDPRIKSNTFSIFGIIIPSVLLVNINNISEAQSRISELISNYENLDTLIGDEELREVTIEILDYLTI